MGKLSVHEYNRILLPIVIESPIFVLYFVLHDLYDISMAWNKTNSEVVQHTVSITLWTNLQGLKCDDRCFNHCST